MESSGDSLNAESSDEPPLLGARVDPEIDRRLRRTVTARRRHRFEMERLLWQAQREDPSCLPVYFALYKFYAHARRLNDASRALHLAISEAARQGGFHCDWERLNTEHAKCAPVDLSVSEAGRYYLLSLKALAFIKLRQRKPQEARALLDHLERLDKSDHSAASMVRTLADSLQDANEHDND